MGYYVGWFPFVVLSFRLSCGFRFCCVPATTLIYRSLLELGIFCSSNPATFHQRVDVGAPALYRSPSTVCARFEDFGVLDCNPPARRLSATLLHWSRIVPGPGQLTSWCLQQKLLQAMPRSLTVGINPVRSGTFYRKCPRLLLA